MLQLAVYLLKLGALGAPGLGVTHDKMIIATDKVGAACKDLIGMQSLREELLDASTGGFKALGEKIKVRIQVDVKQS